jgi:hypothetical protein
MRSPIIVLALVAAMPAQAAPKMHLKASLPPPEYDKPYTGELTITRGKFRERYSRTLPKT